MVYNINVFKTSSFLGGSEYEFKPEFGQFDLVHYDTIDYEAKNQTSSEFLFFSY